jgi:cytochrome bd-type quinol oxidase subunit 1
MATEQVIDMSVYFKQATLRGFLFVVLPAVLIVLAIIFGRRLIKKWLFKEEDKSQEEEKKG